MLYITEYTRVANDSAHQSSGAPLTPPVAEQSILIDFESAQSAPFSGTTHYIFIHTTEDCCLAFGKDPVADPKLHRISAGGERFYGVNFGDRLAVIASRE